MHEKWCLYGGRRRMKFTDAEQAYLAGLPDSEWEAAIKNRYSFQPILEDLMNQQIADIEARWQVEGAYDPSQGSKHNCFATGPLTGKCAIVRSYRAEMIIAKYKLSNGHNIALAMDGRIKKTGLFIWRDQCWQRLALFDSHDALKFFCTVYGMQPPSWLGKSYQEAVERFQRKERLRLVK